MLEGLFRLFFKYPPLVFEQGDFTWGLSRGALVAVIAAVVVAVAALITYRFISGERERREQIVLIALRAAIVAVILFSLFRPTLTIKSSVPQQNFVGVIVDDSRSMSIADTASQPRSQFVQQ